MQSLKQNKIVIDLGATNLRFASIRENKIQALVRLKTPKSKEKLDEALQIGVKKIITRSGASDIIGVSVAGPVKNNLVYLTNITADYEDIKTPLEEAFGVKVELLNDAAAAVFAEREIGKGKGKKSLVYITISTGIGGGVIKNGHLIWFNNVKDEIGHMKVDSEYMAVCKCGGMGHWQAFSAGRTIPHFLQLWSKKEKIALGIRRFDDVLKIFERAKRRDKLTLNFIDEMSRINARAIDMVVEKYQPEVIVLGGSVAQNNREIMVKGIERFRTSQVPLEFTELGDEISLLGVALYAERKSMISSHAAS